MPSAGARPGCAAPRRRQRGVGLIEVLVTVVIMAVGLLGIAALQFMAKRSNFEAAERTTATMLATDMLERMRANPTQLANYVYNGATLNAASSLSEPVDCNTTTTATCTPGQLEQYDLYSWMQMLEGTAATVSSANGTINTSGLISPTACISTTVPAGVVDQSGQYTVAIAWRGQTPLSNPTSSTCGQGSGLYDNTLPNGQVQADVDRRVVVVNTYINAK